MKWCCALFGALLSVLSFGDRTVYASGAPAFVLDTAVQNPAAPLVFRLGFISGNTSGASQRWTATPFHVAYTDTINAIEVAWTYGTTTAANYGYRIYKADGSGGAPGTTVVSGTGTIASLTYRRHEYPNGFEADNYARIGISTTVLTPGDYWITFYGTDGELVWYAGAPGGLNKGHNYRRTTSSSSYAQYTIAANDTRLPNYGLGGMYDTVYPTAGPNPNDLYQTAFSIIGTGAGGTELKGTISETGWAMLPTYALSDGTPQVFELRLVDPSNGKDASVHSFSVDATGKFNLGNVTSGTYNIIIRSVSSYVGKFGIYTTSGTAVSEQSIYQALGMPFLGVQLNGVSVSGASVDLGVIDLFAGDVNLDGAIDLTDLNSELVNFDLNSTVAPVPDGFLSLYDLNGDRKVDLFDLNACMTSFGLTGPHR